MPLQPCSGFHYAACPDVLRSEGVSGIIPSRLLLLLLSCGGCHSLLGVVSSINTSSSLVVTVCATSAPLVLSGTKELMIDGINNNNIKLEEFP
mmetsp:Transcript_16393/g.17842  ORF Transcript_16393/g.17842 Transcript_16393/m.17842 type:complete len:93 (+) Transcript_16393:3-281(+)